MATQSYVYLYISLCKVHRQSTSCQISSKNIALNSNMHVDSHAMGQYRAISSSVLLTGSRGVYVVSA